ncbi:sphingosine kinase 1 [Hibiscus trionum]|uniref:sphingosine kinase n=1 Tax=Hibiscus trionum TaxID=183268 RepID=A0A9W7MAF8_HIBTR|nr:sphingosine kinase 1 [Hibiscus trionum]
MDQSGQPNSLSPLLSDQVLFNGATVPLTFTGDGKLRFTGQSQRCLTVEEVLGFALEGSRIRVKAVVEKRDGICCFGNSGDLERRSVVFEPQSQDSLTLWSQKLRDYIDSLGRPKRLLVFVNPFGGKKSATKVFSEDVKPYLEDADIHITLIETKHQLHAKEVAKSMDLSKYDGIVCVSGDGILVEVVNGLLEREDWSAAIKMPIGMIPAGTGNGMVKSLLHAAGERCSASNAILAVIRGYKRSLDVATISQGKKRFFSVLMLAWGLIADIDIESEKYRWMGSARIDFYGIQRIFFLRHYNGRICFVPAPGFEDYGEPMSYHGEPTSEEIPAQESSLKSKQHGYLGSDVKLENMHWRTISGPFVSIWLHNVPWGSEDAMAAPDAKFSDGYLDLIMLKDLPRLSLLSLMSNMNDGSYVESPHITYLKVKAFVLEPGARVDDPTKEGIIDSDGEVIARGNVTYKGDQKPLMTYNKIQITVDQGLATLFAPK